MSEGKRARITQILLGLSAIAVLTGCSAAVTLESPATLPVAEMEAEQLPVAPTENYGPAPEIGNDVWLNTQTPIRLADQRGKVILVEFWTFG